ncbi:MAG TPA: S8 family serine peptidase [Armatimonadota bacterium]
MRLLAVLLLALLPLRSALAATAPLPPPDTVTFAQIDAETASLQPYERKMDTPLRRLLRDALGQPALLLSSAHASVQEDAAGRILVNVESADVTSLLSLLTWPDVKLTFADSNAGYAQAWMPAARLYDLAHAANVRWLAAAHQPLARVTSEGDSIMQADQARADTGFDGKGVNVGVLSTGNLTASDRIAGNELSASDTHIVRSNYTDDEGTAMMEIVHDLAPASPIFFSSGWSINNQTTNGGSMIGGIRSLAGSKCPVIVDDLGVFDEPMFEDGPVAKEAGFTTQQGIVYVSAAGNDNQEHYLGTYADGGSIYGKEHAHEFAPNVLYCRYQINSGTVKTNRCSWHLQWDDPWNGPAADYDMYLVYPPTSTVLTSSTNITQPGTGHPYEYMGYNNTVGSFYADVVVVLKSGAGGRFHLLGYGGLQQQTQIAPAGAIYGHPAVKSVIAVAAIKANGPHTSVESFSSHGPVEIKYPAAESRPKPDVAGIDGVTTTTPGFIPFFGTSAAAPHVAAVAALLKQAAPEMTPAQMMTALEFTATDTDAPGYDFSSGYGLVNADAAILWIRPDVSASSASVNLFGYEGRYGSTSAHVTLTNANAVRGAPFVWTASAADAAWLHFNRTKGRAIASDEFSFWADTTGIAAPGATGHIVVALDHCVQAQLIITVNLSLTAAGPVVTVDNNGTTLAQAVTFANSHAGTTIRFAVPSSDANYSGGVAFIPGPGLLQITAPGTFIDGFSQTMSGGDTNPNGPEVKISSTLYFTAGNNCVRGVDMANIPNTIGANQVQPAIWFDGPNANGNTVIGCYIGCDPTGQTAAPTQAGVEMSNGASRNRVGGVRAAERNIISGCSSLGVQVFNGGQDNIIVGNWIGIDPGGAHAVGNGVEGVILQYPVSHNVVGGSPASTGNVISGVAYGVVLYGPNANNNRISGNLIGTDPSGNSGIGNGGVGVYLLQGAVGNVIGGSYPGERNVLCANGQAGIVLDGSGATNNRIVGNYIGLTANAAAILGNGAVGGIDLQNGPTANVIGGTTVLPGTANIIVGNSGAGIQLANSADNNFVMGNAIGVTALAGGQAAGNNGPGVFLGTTCTGNVIGGMDPADGTAADAGNHVAFNGANGVSLAPSASAGNMISRNSIHDNAGLGIDLGNDGVPQDDSSPYYKPPTLYGAFLYDGFTLVTGTLHNGTDPATFEFYTTDPASSAGQGQTFLLRVPRSAPGPFTVLLPAIPLGAHVSALAIHSAGALLGDTSEFSNSVDVETTPGTATTPPHVTLLTPNGGTVVAHGARVAITWSVDTGGLALQQQADYSLDSGATWTNFAASIPVDMQSWGWEAPDVSSTHARIRVRVMDNLNQESSDMSDSDFTIQGSTPAGALEALRIAAGLDAATPSAMSSLNVVTTGSSAGVIDILDAVQLCRQAAGL